MSITKISPSVVDFDSTLTLTAADTDTVDSVSNAHLVLTDDGDTAYWKVRMGTTNRYLGIDGLDSSTWKEVITFDRAEQRVGIGTASPTHELTIGASGADAKRSFSIEGTNGSSQKSTFEIENDGENSVAKFNFNTGGSTGTTRLTIDSSGNVGIGNPPLGTGTGQMSIRIGGSGLINAHSGSASSGQVIGFSQNAQYDTDGSWEAISTDAATNYYQGSGAHYFRNAASTSAGADITWIDAMTINSSGVVLVGTTDSVLYNNTSGGGINLHGGGTNRLDVARDDEVCMTLNRMTGDGVVLSIYGQGSFEGGLQVSGSTVSVAGFSGMHESSGIPEDTKAGTVVSTIDVLDTYTEGVKKDQERADHAKIKVSDVSGDKRIYGVFHSLNDQNKPLITAVGIASVRVTGACAGGDLLESAGDGTAKVQSDDVIRSSTLGKVTIGNSNEEEKLVSCVMYCG